jgi:alanyl-tRNA synthetase
VRQTGDIGLFVMLGESASASGVRRVEALTGQAALEYLAEQDRIVADLSLALKTSRGELIDRVKSLIDERRALQNEIADLRKQVAMGGGGAADGPKDVNGVPFLGQVLSGVNAKDLRGLIDEQKGKIGSGVIVLIADTGGKAAVAVGVTADLTERFNAVDLVKIAAEKLGGKGGGGRPDMAQAGGADASQGDAALAAIEDALKG